jgi:hypothetical protein
VAPGWLRTPIRLFTALAALAALVPADVLAAGSPLVSETFANNSTPAGQWSLPAAQSGTNVSCLTAGPVTAATSIPNCASPPDTSGNGALRLTNNGGNEVGTVFYEASLPTSQGLDITLHTYQYNGTGADGIAFILAATDPSSPAPPAVTGPPGGDMGYSANTKNSPATAGVPDGYLGIGLDVYGNFDNTPLAGGSGCTTPSPLLPGKAYPESVTARGPGNGTTGYCILGTTATTYNQSSAGGSAGGTISNVGSGNTLDNQTATSRSGVLVPVEMAINPSASAATTGSGLSVPANSWIIAYTPLGTATQQTLTGALPTTSNNAALASFPPSWINAATGVPYQLTFGVAASTGGSNEYHEVNDLTASSLLGSVPGLALTKSDNEGGHMLAGNRANFVLSPSVSAGGGSEANTLTITDTLPAGMTPGTATASSDWACTTAGQTVSCSYTPLSPIAAGTTLPNINTPVALSLGLSGSITNTARISSTDGLPAASSDQVTVSSFTASALPSPQTYGQSVTYSATLPSSATGTVTFTTGGTTLCTATLSALSCTATNAPVGTDTVTATYSGDSNFAPQTTTTTLTINKATPSITEAAAPATIAYGAQDTLSISGLQSDATGTIAFTAGGSTLCTATLPATSCQTAATLVPGTYNVTATYGGDANYNSATATGASFTVTKASPSITESASPASVPYGTADTLSITGLPVGATGTVTFTSGAATLCTATLPALSCNTSTTLLPATYPVTATYPGDSNDNSAIATGASFTVTKASPTITESASPPAVSFGSADTLSVSGLPSGAMGTVTFTSGGSTLCTATLPATSCATSTSLGPGTYALTATYSGDSNYGGATATGATLTVTKADTAMTESASPASIGYGSQDTLSIAGLPGDATGTVTFTASASTLCTAILPATSCQTATTLAAGTYNVTATYPGDGDYNATTATGASFTVTKATPSFSESAAPASVPYGTADTLSVTGLPAGAGGTVTFSSGSTTLCTTMLPAMSCNTSTSLGPGTYDVTATYSGDSNNNSATATGASFTVTTAGTSMTESAAPASIPYGAQDTLSVAGLPGAATGTVTFTSGSATLCTAPLPAPSCQTSMTLSPGAYSVTATYPGDSNYDSTNATGASFTVTKATTAMIESAAPAAIPYGMQDTLSVTGLPVDVTGTVIFVSGTATLCTATLPATSCQTSATLPPATYPVTATYSGDGNYDSTTANGATFTVTTAPVSMTESASPATIVHGATDTLSASGLPGGATGTVTFTSGSTTLCVATLPATSCPTSASLSPAIYDVTASYSGDGNYNATTATGAQFTVTKSNTSMTVTVSPSQVTTGSSVTLSVSGLPADAHGTVTFTSANMVVCTATLPATSCMTSINLRPGTYPVQATYSGDGNYNGSTAVGSGRVGVSPVIAPVTVPESGSGLQAPKAILGAVLVMVGACAVAIARRRSSNSGL